MSIFLTVHVPCTARFSGVVGNETGDFPRSTIAYSVDAISISIGSLLGLAPVTAFVESGAVIQEAGRTSITAMTTGSLFFLSLSLPPIFASIPPWANGGALLLVECMMMRGFLSINWNYPGDALPALLLPCSSHSGILSHTANYYRVRPSLENSMSQWHTLLTPNQALLTSGKRRLTVYFTQSGAKAFATNPGSSEH